MIKNHLSKVTLIALCASLLVFRMLNISNHEISWDALGYYLPLPATFIYDQPLLESIDWLESLNEKYELSETLYMIGTAPDGSNMYFFFFGTAIFYAPFFFVGHFLALNSDFPADGFSDPYQISLVLGCMIYVFIGLFYLRKIFLRYFSESITSLALITTVVATNYSHHLTVKNLETVNLLFMLVAIIVWNTIRWHEVFKLKNLVSIALAIALIALIKPSEIVIGLFPLLWGVFDRKSIQTKWNLMLEHKSQFLLVIVLGTLVVLPQLLYWKISTGSLIYDSYQNPGVGLDFFSPHIIDALFSYKKGWFLYTPIALFFMIGLVMFTKENRTSRWAIWSYFLITFYIITSWTEWWYGAAFSNRPLITTYPILSIGFAYFLQYLSSKSTLLKIGTAILFAAFACFNQFQWWQLRNYILDPYRTTKEYYLANFLATEVNSETKKLLSVERLFDGSMKLTDSSSYTASFPPILQPDLSSEKNGVYKVSTSDLYTLTKEVEYQLISSKDHAWIIAEFKLRKMDSTDTNWPYFVMTFDRKEGNYQYFAPILSPIKTVDDWSYFRLEYLTPYVRNQKDRFKYFFWNNQGQEFEIRDLKIKVFEKKET